LPHFFSLLSWFRGGVSFEEKALNCQASGGVGVIIYNNENGSFVGGLPSGTSVTIPVAAVSGELGANILKSEGTTGSMVTEDGFTYVFGSTSIAAPHVTGSIAAVWRSCPKCGNAKVLSCITTTTVALGSTGKNEEYGSGLVQAAAALGCLRKLPCCKSKKNKKQR
jgi:serine protease